MAGARFNLILRGLVSMGMEIMWLWLLLAFMPLGVGVEWGAWFCGMCVVVVLTFI